MDQAFDYLTTHKLELAGDYPYTARDDECTHDEAKGVAGNSGWYDVPVNSPSQLRAAAAQQPVSVAIRADRDVFQSYSSGIINSKTCGILLNHGVDVVGYGTSEGTDYWIVRNSWGAGWGDKGYCKIAAGKEGELGVCGINQASSYPIV